MAEDPRPGDGPDSGAAPGAGDPGRAAGPPPSLEESLRAVSEAGSASLGASIDSLRALRGLISADLAMARSAAGRGLAWGGAAVVFGAFDPLPQLFEPHWPASPRAGVAAGAGVVAGSSTSSPCSSNRPMRLSWRRVACSPM